jgi:4-hydroxy-tetrahydrodipicolinate reductase
VKVALVGYGKMGRAIEAVALARGHRVVARVDPSAEGARRRLEASRLGGAEVAFEFTRPDAAVANVRALLEGGVRVVCGTTGWDASPARVARWARAGKSAAVLAPNFSVGVLLFQRIVEDAARRLSDTGLFDPYVVEMHHRAKLDAPSGTAARLAAALADAWGGAVVEGNAAMPVPPKAVHVASVRAGQETGTHTVGFEGAYDGIVLTHRARSREGFALGAVLAAEWVRKRTGVHGMEKVLDGMAAGAARKGGRR